MRRLAVECGDTPIYAVAGPRFSHLRPDDQDALLERYAAHLRSLDHPFRVSLASRVEEGAGPLPIARRTAYLQTAHPSPWSSLLDELGYRLAPAARGADVRHLLGATAGAAELTEFPGHLRVGRHLLIRLYEVCRWPEALGPSTFASLLATPVPSLVSIAGFPLDAAEARREIGRVLRTGATSLATGGPIGEEAGQRLRAAAATIGRRLDEGTLRLWRTAVVVAVLGRSLPELEAHSRAVVRLLDLAYLRLRLLLFRQLDGLLHLCDGASRLDTYLLDSDALARLFLPGWAAPADPQNEEAIGVDLTGPAPFHGRRLERANPSQFVLGQPGSGKSAFVKVSLLRHLSRGGAAAVIVDPEGEYAPVARELGGRAVEHGGLAEAGPVIAWSGPVEAVPWADVDRLVAAHRARGTLTHLVIDEAHLLLSTPSGRATLRTWIKRARKWGVLFTAVSQNVHDFLASTEGRVVLANAGELVLFRQSPLDLASLARLYRLSPAHVGFLTRAGPGECLVVDERTVTPVRILLPPAYASLIDTRPTPFLDVD